VEMSFPRCCFTASEKYVSSFNVVSFSDFLVSNFLLACSWKTTLRSIFGYRFWFSEPVRLDL